MTPMKCELCGSTDFVKENGFFVCQHCKTKYTLNEARKIMGTVKIDKTDETEKLMVLARRAREENNAENAEKYYGLILREDPNNWEAVFFQAYYKAMQSNIASISSAAYSIANSTESTMKLVADIQNDSERNNALNAVVIHDINIANTLSSVAFEHWGKFPSVDGARAECATRMSSIKKIYEALEESLKQYFSNDKEHLLNVQKAENTFVSNRGAFFEDNYRTIETKRLAREISSEDHSYEPPKVMKHACYVATAIYGSYNCPEVWTLRRFRDYKLATTKSGRAFIHTYYAVSPTLVKWFGKKEWFQRLLKPVLDKIVEQLQRSGVESTKYDDREW